jgi:glucose/arabinose dehydrogenase
LITWFFEAKKRLPAATYLLIPVILLSIASCGGGGDEEDNPFGLKSEVVVKADRPITMVFAPDGRLFYGEHMTGNIRIVTPDGTLLEEPFAHIDVQTGLEWGLTGVALDPDFPTNHFVYAYSTQVVQPGPVGGQVTAKPLITRFTDNNNKGVDPKLIADQFPETAPTQPGYNTNGSIGFGPDGFLYATVGDYDFRSPVSQDLSVPMGKILRLNKEDGTAAPDNPFVDTPNTDARIWAYGFREAFEFIFSPTNGQLYGTDNTAVSCEELNIIRKGLNYGFPDIGTFPYSDCNFGQGEKAIYHFAKEKMQPGDFLSEVIVSGFGFVSGQKYPPLGDGLLACESETKVMRRLTFATPSGDQVAASDVVMKDCNMDIAVSPDGTIYYSNDQEIRRLKFEPTPTQEN